MKQELTFFVLVLLVGSSFLLVADNSTFRASAQTEAQGFQIISAKWGNGTSTGEAGPGDQDVPLTITLQYIYPYAALYAQVDILLPAGFSTTSTALSSSSTNNDTAYYANSLQKGQVFQVETFLNLASNVSLGSYTFPTTILWNAVLTNSTSAPEVSLEQGTSFAINVQGDTKLSFSSSQSALTPGQVNNITLTLENSGTGNASNIDTTITSSNPSQVSVLNQFPFVGSLSSEQTSAGSLELFVSSSAAGSSVTLSITTTYLDAYTVSQSQTQTIGLFVSTTSSTSQLVVRSSENSLTPGQVNNLTLVITNEGSDTLSGVSAQVSSSSQAVSVLTEPNVIPTLSPGSSSSLQIGVFVSAASSNTAVTLSVATTYTVVGPNETGTETQNVGLYVSSQAGAASNSSLSIVTVRNDILTGVTSEVVFSVTNTGSSPVYDPVFSLSVSSPLVVMSNSTYSTANSEIAPGQTIQFEATVSSSPSATAGVYDGNLGVTYANEYGISNSQTTQVGFVLTGTIDLIIQDETITQSSGNLTVSGSLLDEGTASAYYASVIGSSNSSSHSAGPETYIGEIDPNTPVPFSTTVPYVLRGSSENLKVVLELTYKDSFGNNLQSNFNATTTVTAAVFTTSVSNGSSASASQVALVQAAFYAILVVVVIVTVVAVIVVRRKRRQVRVQSGEETEEPKVV